MPRLERLGQPDAPGIAAECGPMLDAGLQRIEQPVVIGLRTNEKFAPLRHGIALELHDSHGHRHGTDKKRNQDYIKKDFSTHRMKFFAKI